MSFGRDCSRQLPEPDDIAAVADAYARAVDEAKKTDQTTYSPEAMRAGIESSYPFHPAIRDLYARFRENPGFQQTRALLRLMRSVVANLWESGAANQNFLIAAQDLDLHDDDILREIKQINRTLDVAIAHDIADEQHTAVAETIEAPLVTMPRTPRPSCFFLHSPTCPTPSRGWTAER